MAQEAELRKIPPDLPHPGFVEAILLQPRQRLRAAFAHAHAGVARQLDVAAQGMAGAGAEIGQQAILPAVPQARAGADDVGNGQQVELAELLPLAHRLGEAVHHLGIGDVLALRRGAHQQVMAHQPGDPFDVAGGEAQPRAEIPRILFAQHRMVAAATLGDVVEQRRQQQHLGLGQHGPDLAAKRELAPCRRLGEARHVAQHAQGVFVDGVDVKQVVLHPSEHLAERRQDRRQQTMAIHAPQRLHRRRPAPQQAQESGQHRLVPGQRGAVGIGRLVDAAHGVGAEAQHAGLLQPGDENLHQRRGSAHEQFRIARRQARAVAHEIVAHRLLGRGRLQHLLEALGHLHAKPLDLAGCAVVALHELFDAEVLLVLVLESQACGERLLVIEQQPLLGAPRFQMQGVAITAQRRLGLFQLGLLGGIEQSLGDHPRQPVGLRQAPPHPAQRVERTQAAGAILEVRFEVVGSVVVTGMPRIALGQPGSEVFARGPHLRIVDDAPQLRVEARITGQPSRIKQAGEHAGVLRGQCPALRRLAHGVAHFQTDVPQGGEELLQGAQTRGLGCRGQRQQVHIRIRKQQTAAKPANREQCSAAYLTEAGHPHVHNHPRHRLAAPPRQHTGIRAVAKCRSQAAIHILQQLPQRPARLGRNAGARHRHGQARQGGER